MCLQLFSKNTRNTRRKIQCLAWLLFFFSSPFLSNSVYAFKAEQLESFTVVTVDAKHESINLVWKFDGQPVTTFEKLNSILKRNKEKLIFAMNAGMFMENLAPLGLYIEKAQELRPLNTRSGSGNFYLKPNGVFLITSTHEAKIMETETWLKWKGKDTVELATQSGPMLITRGKIHSGFSKNSENKLIRNAVGVDNHQQVYFVISDKDVSFHEMAAFFKDKLKCTDALYLDGGVSRLAVHDQKLDRFDTGSFFGPMLYISTPKK